MPRPASLARSAALAAACLLSACATQGKVFQTTPVAAINNDGGVALKGYDPVGYFADSKPEAGNPAITTQYEGATYRFASEAHKAAFLSEPTHYTPQFGGFCAFAISNGNIADIDPSEWAVQNDRLYLNNNAFAQHIWDGDRPGRIRSGNLNWPLIPKTALAPG